MYIWSEMKWRNEQKADDFWCQIWNRYEWNLDTSSLSNSSLVSQNLRKKMEKNDFTPKNFKLFSVFLNKLNHTFDCWIHCRKPLSMRKAYQFIAACTMYVKRKVRLKSIINVFVVASCSAWITMTTMNIESNVLRVSIKYMNQMELLKNKLLPSIQSV